MADSDPIARRAIVRAVGLAASTAALAGCIDERTVDDPDGSSGAGAQPSDDGADEDASDDADDDPLEIELYGNTAGWEGVAPTSIEGVENPPLHLEPGTTYRLGWTEGDGAYHNITIVDSDGAVVGDLETEEVAEPDGDQFLEFEASEEMAAYACEPHRNTMRGRIHVGDGPGDSEPIDGDEESDRDRDESQDEERGEESDREQDAFRIEPGTRIRLYGYTAGWEGDEPATIAGVENPTLLLEDGESYEIGWEAGDGSYHNIEIRDENDEVVDGLSTDETAEPEDEDAQFLAFEASEEMASYACNPHQSIMRGEIRVEGGSSE